MSRKKAGNKSEHSMLNPLRPLQPANSSLELFTGPSVEGTDKHYVKVLSGKVERQKPSFV